MKVLMLNGSPNEQGCTHAALTEVGRGLKEQGVDYEILHVHGAIRGCTACRSCSKTGSNRCVFTDDAVNLAIERMGECDGLVVGSPVHYASPAGTLLTFLDRMFFAGGETFAHKPAAAVVSARRAGTTASLDVLNKYFTISEMPVVPSCYWNMVHGSAAADVARDAEGLQTMRQLGRNMGWMIKCFALAREQGIEPPAREKRVRTNFIR